jgi:predicted patatin/cPLA2 family phospholipase
VVVASRVAGERRPEPQVVVRIVARRFPALREATAQHSALQNEALRLAEHPPPGVRVRLVRPARDFGISRLTRDVAKLRAAVEEGRRDGARLAGELGIPPRTA